MPEGDEQKTQWVEQEIQKHASWISAIREQLGRVIVGQHSLVDRLLIGLIANGHVLLEGMPGLAKTLVINTLSQSLQTDFKRLQFTPDLLPADLVGTLIYSPRDGQFETRKGPIFANMILADEINRAPAKVQSALLEAMQERQVTLGDQTYKLPDPFLVMATQNPLEQEGTYRLPEAQLDRFLFKLLVDYPSRDEEIMILDRMGTTVPDLRVDAVAKPEQVIAARGVVNAIYIDTRVREYIVDIVRATRNPLDYQLKELTDLIRVGASPRATINLTLASKALALIQGRSFVTPQDIKDIGVDVLRHRVITSFEAEAEEISSETIISKIFEGLPVP
ncbi:MAG: MoxR-like ATPase [Verrucomicrobiales bacterium]|jgi:MoxR-like ATPase